MQTTEVHENLIRGIGEQQKMILDPQARESTFIWTITT